MDHQIVDKPSFAVVGKSIRVATKDGENMRRIPLFWQECVQDGTVGRLASMAGGRGSVLGDVTLGICADFAADMSEFSYLIAAERPAGGQQADGFEERTIPAAKWAVFEAKGALPDSIQTVWGHIMSEFFETSGYKHASTPDLEVYPPGNPMARDYQCEIWVPVQ